MDWAKADFLELFEEHHLPLYRFAYRMTGSAADAEDIVQECFLELLRPQCSYDPVRTQLRTYLFGVVRNQSLKRRRRVDYQPDPGQGRSPEGEVLRTEVEDAVARAVLELPDTQREVLILAHYEQMPLAEIAHVMDLEVTAVKSRLQRARAGLKELLAAYAPGLEKTMNDLELDEMLDKWNAPAPPESLRERVAAGFHARVKRRPIRWIWGKSLFAAAVLAMLLIVVTRAVPQTMPEVHRPYTVLSEFVQYSNDGSPTVAMYSTSYNDQYGREILLSRYIPDNSVHDTIARMFDSASKGTGSVRLILALLLSPTNREIMAKRAAVAPGPLVNTQCADEKCISGVGHFALPRAAANPGIGCVDGPPVDRETILGYPTAAFQLPLDGNRVRRTFWMAPALGCFALKVSTEAQQPDGGFRLLSGKQAIKVRLNSDPR